MPPMPKMPNRSSGGSAKSKARSFEILSLIYATKYWLPVVAQFRTGGVVPEEDRPENAYSVVADYTYRGKFAFEAWLRTDDTLTLEKIAPRSG